MKLRPGISAIIATHPARLKNGLLARALKSVCMQTLQPVEIICVNDVEKHGAGATRRTILERVQTTHMAWLDSDDWWYPTHLQELNIPFEIDDRVKYTFSWFDGRHDPLGHFGKVYDVANPHHTTITALIDTVLAKEIGYQDTAAEGPYSDEDWQFIYRFAALCHERGYNMVHIPKRTWYWDQSGQNSSGRPDQGDAAFE